MSCHSLGILALNRYELDLSNEVLNIHFSQGASKISEVKFGSRKKIADSAGFKTDAPTPRAELADFFLTSNFDL